HVPTGTLGGGLDQLFARDGLEGQIDVIEDGGKGAGNGGEFFAFQDAADFVAEIFTVLFRGFHGVARVRIGVGAAADHEEGDDAGLALFDGGLGEAGVVAADGVVVGAQSCVVTGAFEQHS